MDLEFSPEDIAFRDEVRAFIEANYPPHLKGRVLREDLSKEDFLAWHKILGKKGWSAPAWPKEYGGTGWTATQRYIWLEENARGETIPPLPFGVSMVGPVIYTFGTPEQKKRFLPGILSGEVWWAQGYSEPGAGSDLASLENQGRARRRLLHRQRPEDLDDARPVRRLGLLPRPHRSQRQAAGRHFLPADRHEIARRQRPPDQAARWRLRGERRLPRQREGAGRSAHLRGKQGLDLRQIPARARTRRHRRRGALEAQRRTPQVDRQIRNRRRRQAADRRRGLPAQARRTRNRSLRARDDRTARARARTRRQGAGAGKFAAEDQGHRNPAAPDRTDARSRRQLRAALSARPPGDNEFPIGPDYARSAAPVYFNWRKASIYGGSNEIQRNIIAKMVLGL